MDIETAVNLPIHNHPLTPSARSSVGECAGCHVTDIRYSGYYCNEAYCYVYFHKECAEAPSEINHPSHLQHLLLLTNDSRDGPCDLCGKELLSPCYCCPTCEFKVDLTCGLKPSPIAIEHRLCHDHPLTFLKKREEEIACEVCKDSIGGPSYSCLECSVYFHLDCIHFTKEIDYPCHSNHPLKFTAIDTLEDDAEKICLLCQEEQESMIYHCSICNFTTCLACTRNLPPLVVEHSKTHKHPLTIFARRISYTCNLCGEEGNMRPYLCLQCDFSVHSRCISLARVININRHDHRISFTHHLGPGYLKCGVCRKNVSRYCGAYSCTVCPDYAVHSHCVLETDVWDGKELEGLADDDNEDTSPFKVVGDNLIIHFSHEKHTLRLHKNNIIRDECTRCEACNHPVGFDSLYSCEECQFALHEKCANQPLKKRLVFSFLRYNLVGPGNGVMEVVDCTLCGVLSTGFMYTSPLDNDVDLHCASLSEPFIHKAHLHPLYFDEQEDHYCDACRKDINGHVLRCDDCDFDLCLYCASMPEKIWHRNDKHPLTLSCGEEASGKYWCDICERELDPSKWFYTCSDCGVTLHAQCVIGDFSRFKPGGIINYRGYQFEAVLNNLNTRPVCSMCLSRCKMSVILKDLEDGEYICSRLCFSDLFPDE